MNISLTTENPVLEWRDISFTEQYRYTQGSGTVPTEDKYFYDLAWTGGFEEALPENGELHFSTNRFDGEDSGDGYSLTFNNCDIS